MITALSYLGVRCDDLAAWSDFAGRQLGMQQIDRGGGALAFRMDDRCQRLSVSEESGPALGFCGWEVSARADLDDYGARLDRADIAVASGDAALCDRRGVAELIFFDDPDGNRVELCWAPQCADRPFQPGRPLTGFNTGPLGMGHAVLQVRDADTLLRFYRDLLGFRISDYGLEPYPMYFLHVNGRHHSLALIGSGQRGLHHFMIEFDHLDDVGQGYDIACAEPGRIAYTLGRHSNDYMTSFYSHSPSGFFVESGFGGRIIDPSGWRPRQTFDGPSFWGHERLYLPEPERARFRALRADAAARGRRAPPFSDCPWLCAPPRR